MDQNDHSQAPHSLPTLAAGVAWLLDEPGAAIVATGGGCHAVRIAGPAGWAMLISSEDGDLPEPGYWLMCVYAPNETEERWGETTINGADIDLRDTLTEGRAVMTVMAEAAMSASKSAEA